MLRISLENYYSHFVGQAFLFDTLFSLKVLWSRKLLGSSAPVSVSAFLEISRFVLYNVCSCPFTLEVLIWENSSLYLVLEKLESDEVLRVLSCSFLYIRSLVSFKLWFRKIDLFIFPSFNYWDLSQRINCVFLRKWWRVFYHRLFMIENQEEVEVLDL